MSIRNSYVDRHRRMSIVAHGFTALRYVYTRREYYVERRLSRLRNCGGKNEDSTSCAVRRALKTARRGGHRPRPQGPPSSLAAGHPRDARDEARWHSADEISRPRAAGAPPAAGGAARGRGTPRASRKKTHIAVRVCVQCADERPDRTRCAGRARLIGLSAPASFVSRLNSPLMWLRTVPSCGPPTSPRVGRSLEIATISRAALLLLLALAPSGCYFALAARRTAHPVAAACATTVDSVAVVVERGAGEEHWRCMGRTGRRLKPGFRELALLLA